MNLEWINNMLSNVNNYKLVVYTNDEGSKYIDAYSKNNNIKIVIKPVENFHMYKYKSQWENNHKSNYLLKDKVDWRVNMLWSEKIFFVKETIEQQYFNTDFYGWCDIGYFRGRWNDLTTTMLHYWPDPIKLSKLDINKIYYAYVNNSQDMSLLQSFICNKNAVGLPKIPIPDNQVSVAGGFFILHKDLINWWSNTYESKLSLYFLNNRLVKDDQIIIADCIFSNIDHFSLQKESHPIYDNWFMFQRLLL